MMMVDQDQKEDQLEDHVPPIFRHMLASCKCARCAQRGLHSGIS